jgi:hypothetical protein
MDAYPVCPTCNEVCYDGPQGGHVCPPEVVPGSYCTVCKNPLMPGRIHHKCPPAWLVWNPEHGDLEGARMFYAHSVEVAVSAWAEQDDEDSADYLIARGNPVVVCVKSMPDGPVARYRVTGEYEPTYSVEPVE